MLQNERAHQQDYDLTTQRLKCRGRKRNRGTTTKLTQEQQITLSREARSLVPMLDLTDTYEAVQPRQLSFEEFESHEEKEFT